MKFYAEHGSLRVILIAVFFVSGMAAVLFGMSMAGKMAGVFIMLVGLALLLTALWLYNKPFSDTPKPKR